MNDDRNNGNLPKGWEIIPIEDSLREYENGSKIRQGWSPQCERFPAITNDDWGVLKTSAIQDGLFVEQENKHLPNKLKPRTHLEVKVGDILITCAGPRSRCGVACIVRRTRPKLMISGKMYQLRCEIELINPHFLELFLREPGTRKKLDEMKTGISDSGLNLTHKRFSTLAVPLPPFNEQHRIVSKIEELFSELDAGIESLKRAHAQLGVYRQALLKKAFEGKLTEKWREANPDKQEPADQLLARIRKEREARYEQQLEDWKTATAKWKANSASGKKPVKPRKPKPVEPLTAKELADLPELPEGWVIIRLGEIIEGIDAGKSFACDERTPTPEEVGVAKVSAVTWWEYNEDESKTCRDATKENEDYLIRKNDFLLSRANTIELVGACVIAKKVTKRIMLSDKTLRIRFHSIQLEFVLQFLRCRTGRLEIMKRSTGNQESMRNIGQDRIAAIIVPLCSLSEQREIVRILEKQFSTIEQNEKEIDVALKRAEALRQSILKKAFSGQLVEQDPNDEPAKALLERIRAERNASAKKKIQRKKRAIKSKPEQKTLPL